MTKDSNDRPSVTTIKDVAKYAGLSVGTVSRVLNGGFSVSADARKKVEMAIEALAYTPNTSARRLRTGRSGTVGFCTRDITNPLFSEMARAIQEVLEQHKITMLVSNAFDDPDREKEMVGRFIEQSVDGLILGPSTDDGSDLVELAAAHGIPVAVLDRDSPSKAVRVNTEHATGMRQAVNYLIDLGHRDIAIVTGDSSHLAGRSRMAGFRRAFEDRNLNVPEHFIYQGAFSREFGEAAATQLFHGRTTPSAVICGGAPILLGVLPIIHNVDLSIPNDISLISCDDIDLTRLYRPAVTVVRRSLAEIGRIAAQAVIDLSQAPAPKPQMNFQVPTELVVRESCAPLGQLRNPIRQAP